MDNLTGRSYVVPIRITPVPLPWLRRLLGRFVAWFWGRHNRSTNGHGPPPKKPVRLKNARIVV
jgi:hypothetical protein